MTLEQLDVVRGWSIAAVILSFVVIGVSSKVASRAAQLVRIAAQIVGGLAALTLFFILNFVAGWDEYFAAKSADLPISEYHGRHQTAARVIESLGELDASSLGIVFGLVGLAFIVATVLNIRGLRRST